MGKSLFDKVIGKDPIVGVNKRVIQKDGKWVEDDGGLFSRLGEAIKNPAVIGMAGAALNDGDFDMGDVVKVALATAAIYKLAQAHQLKIEKQQQKEVAMRERQEMIQQRKEFLETIKNPKGMMSKEGSYGVADVAVNLAQKIPVASTDTYKNLSPEEQSEYAKFANAEAQHKANYVQAFAKKDCSMADCEFYDVDGKRLDVFTKIPADATPDARAAIMVQNMAKTDAMIYAMDHGYVTCKLPNGETFYPNEDKCVARDTYTKNLDEMDNLSRKYAQTKADIDTEIADRLENMTDLEKADFIPKKVSSMDRKSFAEESLGTARMTQCQSMGMAYSYEQGARPFDRAFEAFGGRVPEPEEIAERSKARMDERKAEFKEKAADVGKAAMSGVGKGAYNVAKKVPIVGSVMNMGEDLVRKASDKIEEHNLGM